MIGPIRTVMDALGIDEATLAKNPNLDKFKAKSEEFQKGVVHGLTTAAITAYAHGDFELFKILKATVDEITSL